MKKTKFLLLFFFVLSGIISHAQNGMPPFWDEIKTFKKMDAAKPPPQQAILFVGSSSFRLWPNIQTYFPGYTIINRGFGGSSIPDVIVYADNIIFPYNPRQIVIYCGDNDLAAAEAVSSRIVLTRFRKLFGMIRQRLPEVSIVFVSIKPSPSRQKLMPKMAAANDMIRKFLKKNKNTAFVDVYHPMLAKNGRPLRDIFREDLLHMNEKGYDIWKQAITPYLIRD
jgi:lysophospholipase L1-like esterase